MSDYTLTYSESAKGWQSFYSYKPEKMIGMNSKFYSFKDGKLYVHNSDITFRNNFYGTQYVSRISGVINEDPYSVKTFKTFVLDSTSPWDATFTTDLDSGFVDSTWFSLKEGDYFAYIRRNEDDDNLKLRSAQGIGTPSNVDSSDTSAVVVTFSFNVDSIISIGDELYSKDGLANDFIGSVTSVSKKKITVDTTVIGGAVPSVSNYMFYVKNSIAESYGTTGYYLKYELENNSMSFVEMFSIGSNLFKSYP